MEWEKRNSAIKTLKEYIEDNTGLSEQELLNPPKDPYIAGISEAAKRILSAIKDKTPVTIIGDYDVDGMTSTSIMLLGLKLLGCKPKFRIPRRLTEGFGINNKIVDEINEGLVITVDNGIAAIGPVARAKEKGLDVIVTDHHLLNDDGEIPAADIIVDPSALPGSDYASYCGAAIAYRLIRELFVEAGLSESNISVKRTLEIITVLAGIATVADVTLLTGDNRNIVKESLRLINKRAVTEGLNCLLNVMSLSHITEEDYGYGIGPVMNASGRLYDTGPDDVIRLITSDPNLLDTDYEEQIEELTELAKTLVSRNGERQRLVATAESKIKSILAEKGEEAIKPPLILYDESFHEGIIGILAGHLAEKYDIPVLVFTQSSNPEVAKGSGRTGAGVNLKAMIDSAAELFVRYGGHPEAAGMSIKKDMLNELQDKLSDYYVRHNFKSAIIAVEEPKKLYDLEITPAEVADTALALKRYAPFGNGNRLPVFKITGYSPILQQKGCYYKQMGQRDNIKFTDGISDATVFERTGGSSLYTQIGSPAKMDILGTVSTNVYKGRETPRIDVKDLQSAVTKKRNNIFDISISGEDMGAAEVKTDKPKTSAGTVKEKKVSSESRKTENKKPVLSAKQNVKGNDVLDELAELLVF